MNTIFIHDLRLDTKVGVYDWERQLPQTVRIDVDIGLPSTRPFMSGTQAIWLRIRCLIDRAWGRA